MAWSPAKPVRFRRCPATVMPLPGGDEPGRLARADELSSEEGRFVPMPVRASQRAHFVLHGPTEDDHADSLPVLAALAAALALAALAAACGSTQASNTGSAAQPPAPRRRQRSRSRSRRPTARCTVARPADGDRVAVPHRHRDAVRDRRGRPGEGGRLADSDYPPQAPQDQAVRLPAERRGDRRRKAGPGRSMAGDTAAADQEAGRVLHPGARPARAGQPGRRVRRVRRAGPGHRPPGPGRAGSGPDARPAAPDRRRRAAPRQADHLLLRTGPDLLLGHLGHVRRPAARPARHEEHRGPGQGRGQLGRLPAAVRGVHPQGQPGLHHPGRHHLLPSGRGHGGQAARLVRADRGQGRATSSR